MAAQVDLADSNVAGIGSDADKDLRKYAASMEVDWVGAGTEPGIDIWRVENVRHENGNPNFGINRWPKEDYGNFFRGDSYIVLKTTKVEEKLIWDVFFWIGAESSQDEYGVAAYKANELDDLLGGFPVQHREVEGYESHEFVAGCFPQGIKYMDGGIASGFRHVSAEGYKPRLFQVRKDGSSVRNFQVPLERASLNQGDAFVLDAGRIVYTWFGDSCSAFEKQKAGASASNIVASRMGKSEKKDDADSNFWELLGGEGDICPAIAHAPTDVKEPTRMYVLSDADSVVRISEIMPASKDAFTDDDAFIIDVGCTIYVYIGKAASKRESQQAMSYAMKHITETGKPITTKVVRVMQGQGSDGGLFEKFGLSK
jgi:gelsolin